MRRISFVAVLSLCAAARVAAAGLDPDLLAGFDARLIGPAGMSGRVAAVEAVPPGPRWSTPARRPAGCGNRTTAV